jgi:hypothetical protein
MLIKYAAKILMFFLLISFSFVLYACACNCGAQEDAEIPASVIKKANQFIIEKTGEIFFKEYIRLDLSRSKEKGDKYTMAYRLILPGKSYVNEIIEFDIDQNGNVMNEDNAKGIPNCKDGECNFDIDETQAKNIAQNAGLKAGVIDWKMEFIWNEKHNSYVWHILSTEYESKGSEGFRGNGEEILIDPNSGEVLEKNEWFVR